MGRWKYFRIFRRETTCRIPFSLTALRTRQPLRNISATAKPPSSLARFRYAGLPANSKDTAFLTCWWLSEWTGSRPWRRTVTPSGDLGKPPDFVLEVASIRTADNDVTGKRRDYADFGIPEYWRFDPTGRERYDAPLAGDRLAQGSYQPVEVIELEPGHLHGHSEVLNLDPCWDHGQLRWYDPVAGEHRRTFNEEREGRLAAEARVRELEEELRRRRARLMRPGLVQVSRQ